MIDSKERREAYESDDMHKKRFAPGPPRAQMLIVLGFIVYVILLALAFNNNFNKAPYDLFGIEASGWAK